MSRLRLSGFGSSGGGGGGGPPPDSTPDAFSFTSISDANLSVLVVSDPITVNGINVPTTITTDGQYRIGSGGYTSSSGSVVNGDQVYARLTTSASYSTPTTITVTIGGVPGTFTVTTKAAPPSGGVLTYFYMGF